MSTADEIGKLHQLLQAGAITQEEFDKAKARLLAGQPAGLSESPLNRFRLSNEEKWIAGVCGGIAEQTGIDAWIWRVLFVLGGLAYGAAIVLYILLWIFVPREGE